MKGKKILLVFTSIKLTIKITTPVKSVNMHMVNNKNDIFSIFNIFHHDNYMFTLFLTINRIERIVHQ